MPAGLARTLVALRKELERSGETLDPVEVARRLFSIHGRVPIGLARRLLAPLLGESETALPDRLDAHALRPPHERRVVRTPLERASFCVVDLETTGLSAARCEILEFGAVRVVGLEVGDSFESLVRPATPVPRRITAITGIDDAAVAEAPPLAPTLRRFRRWLARDAHAPFVAHNAAFDSGFVAAALGREGLDPLDVPILCTCKLARRIAPEIGRYNLDHVAAHFGVSNRARHRALGDAAATARIWVELLTLGRQRHGLRTVGDLLDLQERRTPARRRSRPGARRASGSKRC